MERQGIKKVNISLKLFIICCIVVICGAVIGVTNYVYNKVYYNENKEAIKSDMLGQGRVLQEKLIDNGMTVDQPVNINGDIDSTAAVLGGRIMVINSEYRVIKDTYGERLNSIIVNSEKLFNQIIISSIFLIPSTIVNNSCSSVHILNIGESSGRI